MDFKETRRLRGHVGAVLCARYTKDGAYALTCGADRSVKLWNPSRAAPDTGALLIKNYTGPHAREISQIAVADDCARFVRTLNQEVVRGLAQQPLMASDGA
mgnify:CR=1 FL=1